MTTYGDFQSIFQLAAGLTLGVSGLVTLFEDPVDRESKRFSSLVKRASSLKRRHDDLGEDFSTKIQDLIENSEDYQEKISLNADRDGRFWWLKMLSFVASVVGLALLIHSSDSPNDQLPLFWRMVSYLLLAYAPVATLVIAVQFWKVSREYRADRKKLDGVYVDLVNCIWEYKGKATNAKNGMA